MAPALRFDLHAEPDAHVATWLGYYKSATPSVRVGSNASIRLDLENEPQPDGVLLIDPTCGGQARLSPDHYIEGSPELVVEVSASTVSIDLNTKLRVYRRNGVREYLVWRVNDAAFDWFELRQGQYERLAADTDGIIRSVQFPGLWLDTRAMIGGDLRTVLKTLERGLATKEHAEFVASLRSRRP